MGLNYNEYNAAMAELVATAFKEASDLETLNDDKVRDLICQVMSSRNMQDIWESVDREEYIKGYVLDMRNTLKGWGVDTLQGAKDLVATANTELEAAMGDRSLPLLSAMKEITEECYQALFNSYEK